MDAMPLYLRIGRIFYLGLEAYLTFNISSNRHSFSEEANLHTQIRLGADFCVESRALVGHLEDAAGLCFQFQCINRNLNAHLHMIFLNQGDTTTHINMNGNLYAAYARDSILANRNFKPRFIKGFQRARNLDRCLHIRIQPKGNIHCFTFGRNVATHFALFQFHRYCYFCVADG